MIVSHKHRFIFLKTKKTAGSSLEAGLSRFCGADDIITAMGPEDERARSELGGRGAQNERIPLGRFGAWEWRHLLLDSRWRRYVNHLTASEARRFLPGPVWDQYFKFCFERNPWDRMVSLYYFRNRTSPRPSMSEFLASEWTRNWIDRFCVNFYSIDGEIAVDKVYRFEEMDCALEELRELIGLPERIELPKLKGQFRKDRRSYRELYNDTDRAEIERLFAREIALFGYEF